MSAQQPIAEEIAATAALMGERMGASGESFAARLRKVRHRLPRRLRAPARALAKAEPLAAHPRLCRTLDAAALRAAAAELRAWLEAVDLADRRRGWWLGMLGGLAFNLLVLAALVIAVLLWRGYL